MGTFELRLDIRWPAHAGGYPSPRELCTLVESRLGLLRADLGRRVNYSLEAAATLVDVRLLHTETRITVFLSLDTSPELLSQLRGDKYMHSLGAAVADDLASGLKTFVLTRVADARRGANAYSVSWSLADVLSTESAPWYEVQSAVTRLAADLAPAAEVALANVDFNRIRRIRSEYERLIQKPDTQQGGTKAVQTTLLGLSRTNGELGDELDRSGLGEVLRQHSEAIRGVLSDSTLPALDGSLLSSRVASELRMEAQTSINHLLETSSFRKALQFDAVDAAPEHGSPKRALHTTAAIGRIAIGGLFAASNIALGVVAGVMTSIPTLGLGTVAAAVGIGTSAYTGLNGALSGLKELGDAGAL